MTGRLTVVVLSLAVLGGAGWASWTGLGIVDRDADARSLRTGSPGVVVVPGRFRVK